MIVSFTGAQSTGKTTLLNSMRSWKELRNYKFIDEITRDVGRKGLKINEEGDDATQRAIMKAHCDNLEKGRNIILDRCSLDGVVYTHYLYLHGKVTKETLDLAKSIFLGTFTDYDIIFYLKPEFNIVEDGVRSTDVQFRDEIAKLFEEYIDTYNLKNLSIIELTGSVEERLKTVKKAMNL